MNIEIKGVTYTIDLVNNWVHEKYSQMSLAEGAFLILAAELQMVGFDKETLSTEKYWEKMEQIREKEKEVSLLREAILKELLVKNGYEYNKEYWDHDAEPKDRKEFIEACIQKDKDIIKQSKKK